MRFIYGTANFKENYGLLKSKINIKNINLILNYAKKININYIDTALAYERTYGEELINYSNFRIYSKLKKIPKNIILKKDLENFIDIEIKKEFKKYNIKKLEGYYLHNTEDLKKHGNNLRNIFKKLKKKKVIKYYGLSIYDIIKEYRMILKFKPDIIQLPFNFLNYNSRTIFLLKKIKEKKIKIIARSIFLQGLILKHSKNIEKKFKYIKQAINLIEKKKYNSPNKKILLTISVLKKVKVFDGVILSFKNLNEFKNFIVINNSKKNININFLKSIKIDFKYMDPRKWTKQK